MQLLLILQMIMHLVKTNWFSKIKYAPFINCISKINGVKIDNAEGLDFVMPMYNLLEYDKNYTKTIRSLRNYYRDEPNSSRDNNNSFNLKFRIF